MTTQSDVNDLLWLAAQIIQASDAENSPLVAKFTRAVLAKAEALEVGERVLAYAARGRVALAYEPQQVDVRPGWSADNGPQCAFGDTPLEVLRKLDAPEGEGE